MAQTPQSGGNHSPAAPRAPVGNSHAPELKVMLDPPNKVFSITADAQMPRIKATCQMPAPTAQTPSVAATPGAATQSYEWDVTLVLNPSGVPHAVGRTTRHAPIHITTNVPQLALPLTQVRGGTLTVTVATMLAGKRITGKATALILGTNPSSTLMRTQGASELLMKLMMLESGLKQFLTDRAHAGYPVFSHDGLGGVGLGQITRPRPSDDQVWDWKSNLKGSKDQWDSKRLDAKRILNNYQKGASFLALVAEYNARRTAPAAVVQDTARTPQGNANAPKALKPLTIKLPAITDEMLDNETLRLYNGAPAIQEYVAETDQNGLLVVDVDPAGASGTARWHQVTAEERRAVYLRKFKKTEVGDPDYVTHVRAQVVP